MNPAIPSALLALLFLATAIFRRNHVTTRRRASLALLSVLFLFDAAAAYWAPGRDLLGVSFSAPGSLVSRGMFHLLPDDPSGTIRRAADPESWLLLLLLLTLPAAFRVGAVAWYAIFSAQVAAVAFSLCGTGSPFGMEIGYLQGLFWLLMILGCAQSVRGSSGPGSGISARLLLAVMAGGVIFLCLLSERAVRGERAPRALAHYYSWFPENFAAGYRDQDDPTAPQPALGEYRSGEREVVHAHAEWGKAAGISCFVLDWWPTRRAFRDRILHAAEQFAREEKMCTALLYETLDLRQPHEPLLSGERENIVFLSPERTKGMAEQWVRLVQDYMRRPGYLRIGGRPVLFLYATRHLVGDIAKRLEEARAVVRARTGEELYLIGDEIYFEVPAGDGSSLRLLPTFEPNWDRLRAFDALGVYNPYDSSRPEHGGVSGAERFLADTALLLRRYRAAAATLGIPILPTAIPGYDDRAHRPLAKHFAVPRALENGGSFFERSLADWVAPNLGRGFPFFTITSWNEWNEHTAIEPSRLRDVTSNRELESLCRFLQRQFGAANCEIAFPR